MGTSEDTDVLVRTTKIVKERCAQGECRDGCPVPVLDVKT